MNKFENLELFSKEIYAIEQFVSYQYYYETLKLWEEMIYFVEKLLNSYSSNLTPDHRANHTSQQADYVWGAIVLPNFKATLHHLLDGLTELKQGFLPILRRMSSIRNDIIAQGRDYPIDWMDTIENGAIEKYRELEKIIFTRATNIFVASDYHTSQWDYSDLLDEKNLIGIIFPEPLPTYKLNPNFTMKTGEPILRTGIYRSVEPYSACNFLIKEKKMSTNDWKLAPKVRHYENDPQANTAFDQMEDSTRVDTTWILVEKITDEWEINNINTSLKSGEKVSNTGYWITPAKPNTRQYFKQGEVLPILPDSDWGEVYWYFDGKE